MTINAQALDRVLRCVAPIAVLVLASHAASAGPFAEFEKSLATAYAPYRAALMQTNQKDKAATERSLQAFESKWAGLMTIYRTAPPPQYADDPKWPETVAGVERVIAAAKADAASGELAKAHDVLEGIRARLGELRSRNGVITHSDRMDAYHEKMEAILTGKYAGFDATGLGALREDAAVLLHLVGLIERFTPAAFGSDPAYREGLALLTASARALQSAARSGDKPAIEKAMQGLKQPYAKLFVAFG